MAGTLEGKSVAVLVETEYIPFELEHYRKFFVEECGARLDFITNLWGEPSRKLICDITDTEHPETAIHTMTVNTDVAACNPNDYAVILCAANYVACRLREIPPMHSLGSVDRLRTPPAVQFFASAMMNKSIVKGALCHALWLLTPTPELLAGRKVTCHTVVLADVHNAGAIFVPAPSHVVVDDDLVTGRSAGDLTAYTDAILATYLELRDRKFPE